ncbi:MAG: hypothetical protein HFJ41_05745 [Clostridia bacterium]|nr:hypothetical protein [Clostridia bacterium]
MPKFTIEDEKRLIPFVEEAIRCTEENGTYTEEEFWKLVEEDERMEENQMRILSKEDIEIFTMLAEEAERDIEQNGGMSWNEFWQRLEEDERREGLYKKTNMTKLRLAKYFGKISKKFVRV